MDIWFLSSGVKWYWVDIAWSMDILADAKQYAPKRGEGSQKYDNKQMFNIPGI